MYDAISKNQKFEMQTEVDEDVVGKFDDLVIEYEDHALVLQAKHQQEPTGLRIDDFAKREDYKFSLAKYFDSWCKIEQRKPFGDKPTHYVLFTNQPIHTADLLYFEQKENEKDNTFLGLHASQTWLLKTALPSSLQQAVQEQSLIFKPTVVIDLTRFKDYLSEKLKQLEFILINSIKQNYLILKKQLDLLEPLLLGLLQKEGEERSDQYRFCDDFIRGENLNETQSSFRTNLKLKASELSQVRFTLPQKFLDEKVWSPEDASKKLNLRQENSTEGQKFSLIFPNEDAIYLFGMFHSYVLDYDVLKTEHTLHASQIKFHKVITKLVKTTGFDLEDKMKEQGLQKLQEFLCHFRIKAAQPHEEGITDEMVKRIRFTFNYSTEQFYDRFLSFTLQWMKTKSARVITDKIAKDFLDQTVANVPRLYLAGPSAQLTEKLQQHPFYSINFSQVQPIIQFLEDKNYFMMQLSGIDLTQQLIVLTQVIQRNGYTEDEAIIVDAHNELAKNCAAATNSSNLKLLILYNAEEFMNSADFENIIRNIQKKKTKLLIISSFVKVKNYCEREKISLSECHIDELDDASLANLCQSHLDHYISMGGIFYPVTAVLQQKNNAIYHAMRRLSYLQLILKSAQSTLPSIKPPIYLEPQVEIQERLYHLDRLFIDYVHGKKLVLWVKSDKPEEYILSINKSLTDPTKKTKTVVLNFQEVEKFIESSNEIQDLLTALLLHLKCITEDDAKRIETMSSYTNGTWILIIKESNLLSKESVQTILNLHRGPKIIICSESATEVNQNLLRAQLMTVGEQLVLQIDHSCSRQVRDYPSNANNQHTVDKTITQFSQLQSAQLLAPSAVRVIASEAGTGKTTNLLVAASVYRSSLSSGSNNYYQAVFYLRLSTISREELRQPLAMLLVKAWYQEEYGVNAAPINFTQEPYSWWLFVIEHQIKQGKIKLLIDSWDEIKGDKSSYQNFIQTLPSTIDYDIATRPYELHLLPHYDQLVVLKPFDELQKAEYIRQFFENVAISYSHLSTDDGRRLVSWTEKMIVWLKAQSAIGDFISIPLQTYLFCESMLPLFYHFLQQVDQPLDIMPEEKKRFFTLDLLYQEFFFSKAAIFLEKHIGTKQLLLPSRSADREKIFSLSEKYFKLFQKISFYVLFPHFRNHCIVKLTTSDVTCTFSSCTQSKLS